MLSSMTAFARSQTQGDWGGVTWEIKTVNHRYLDIYFRLPDEFRGLEQLFREKIQQYLARGKVDVILKYQPSLSSSAEIKVNDNAVVAIAKATQLISTHFEKSGSVNPLHVLQWPGVMQESELGIEKIQTSLVDSLEMALKELVKVRQREGDAIVKLLLEKLAQMQSYVGIVEKYIPDINTQQREKLLSRIKEIQVEVDNDRLEQELLYYAQRIDVSEELDRLITHINEFKRLIEKGGIVGRRFDFLLQELNREANTLSSKSVDTKQTHAAVELKVLIEQMREQVQNVE